MRKNISSKNVSKNETTKATKTLKLSKTIPEEKAALKKAKTGKLTKTMLFMKEIQNAGKTMKQIREAKWNVKHVTFYNCFNTLAKAGKAQKVGKKMILKA